MVNSGWQGRAEDGELSLTRCGTPGVFTLARDYSSHHWHFGECRWVERIHLKKLTGSTAGLGAWPQDTLPPTPLLSRQAMVSSHTSTYMQHFTVFVCLLT